MTSEQTKLATLQQMTFYTFDPLIYSTNVHPS